MRNFLQNGDTLSLTAPSGGVTSGLGVLVGSIFSVAAFSAAAGEIFEGRRVGCFRLAAASGAGTDFVQGTKLYWDDTAKNVTKTATSNTAIGYAIADKAAGGTTADVVLVPGGV
jgi:predicted RecA/RadA family phage recombinase